MVWVSSQIHQIPLQVVIANYSFTIEARKIELNMGKK